MKRLIMIMLPLVCMFFSTLTFSQTPCETVTTVAYPRNPQTGSNNYFGVRISIPETYTKNITVSGYIYEDGSFNTNNPFTLTITAGNTSAETSDDFFITDPTGIAVVSVTSVSNCPAPNYLEDFSSEYVKKHVAVIDFYVRSVSSTNFVREIYFKNYGSEALPSVVGFNNDLLFDDGTHNDQVSGDGIYTSTDTYAHTSTIPHTGGVSISVSQDYAVIDNLFEHESSLNTFLSTYNVPGTSNIAGIMRPLNKISSHSSLIEMSLSKSLSSFENSLTYDNLIQDEIGVIQHTLFDNYNKEKALELGADYFKFKASIKCDVGGCNCRTCNCRACDYRWGQRLNWCFYMTNCSVEIGWGG